MSDSTQHPYRESRLRHLVEVYCNGTATDYEFTELEQCLGHDAAARDLYLRYMMLESAVRDFAVNSASGWDSGAAQISDLTRPVRLHRRPVVIAIGLTLIVLAAWSWLEPRDNGQEPHPRIVCVLEKLSGQITVAGSDGEVRTARSGDELSLGDTVRTQESLSTASLVYPDGTQLSLVGKSSITINSDQPKSITVHGGALFASVVPQPADNPMRIATHTDSLEILGTRFTLDTTTDETDVSVTEGRVRLTRTSDGKSVDVPAGQRVVSNAWSPLVLEEILRASAEWAEDFERGLPDGWESGRLVATDLPPKSQAAVQSVRVRSKVGEPFEIATSVQWSHGLFEIHEDTHLHFTFKMRNPGWINIVILTRTIDNDPPTFAGNYLFDEAEWWQVNPDRWATANVPLSAFRPLPPAQAGFKNAIPFQVLFSSPEGDRELMIDQIVVKRGGPGHVVIKESP
jgi:ferric-dicitrate binding protein FerR (iron transport regulator)